MMPQIETSTITGFEDCVAADIVSLEPGLARVKLVVSNEVGTPILKHQFLSIWMSLNTPLIDEVGSADPTGDPRLGDPPGDGIFVAGDSNGRIQVKVTGSFPHPLGPGGSFTLPDAWPTLANALADDSDSNPDNNAARWDIHDDLTKAEGHVGGYCGPSTLVIDAVDNCRTPSTASGPFSRVYGDSSGPTTFGPFDPLVLSTLLSDGNLNAGDAPMPAARVDVQIAKNTGGADINGVGSLEPANKAEVYSRNTLGTADCPQLLRAVLRVVHPVHVASRALVRNRRAGTGQQFPRLPGERALPALELRGGPPDRGRTADAVSAPQRSGAGVPPDPGRTSERGRLHGRAR